MRERPLRLGVLISGSGSNLQAVLDRIADGSLNAEVVVVISDQGDAYGLERATAAGVEALFHDRRKYDSPGSYNVALRGLLVERDVELVVMAGYMRLLGAAVLDAFPNAVMNLHPALLPAFPGAAGVREAYEYGVKVTGVTVHFADEVFDRGPIIAQEAVRIEEGESVEELTERVHEVEHRLLPHAIGLFADGRLKLRGRRVHVSPPSPA